MRFCRHPNTEEQVQGKRIQLSDRVRWREISLARALASTIFRGRKITQTHEFGPNIGNIGFVPRLMHKLPVGVQRGANFADHPTW